MPDMATSRRTNLVLGSHRDDADYGRSVPPLKKQLSSGQKRFNQIPRSPLCPTGIASIEILPSAWVQTSFRHRITNQTPGGPEAVAARRLSSGMARISAVLSTRNPGQKKREPFLLWWHLSLRVNRGYRFKKGSSYSMAIRLLPAAIRANPFYQVRPYRSLCRYESVRQCTLCPFTPGVL